MSDYFAALVRSSGIALPQANGSARPVAERAAPVEVSRVEQAPLLEVPASDAIGGPAYHSALTPPSLAVQPATPPSKSEAAAGFRHDATRDDSAASAQVIKAQATEAAPLANAAAEEASRAPQPPLAQALIDAALRWVAAGDAPHRQQSRPLANEPAPSVHMEAQAEMPAHDRQAPNASSHRIAAPTVAHEILSLPVAHEPGISPLPVVRESSIALLPLHSETRPRATTRAASTVDRDPPLDISIGAIHVRVDAPAAQTVTQALAPRPAAAPRANSGRSGLARRALRRI